jgi:hypothetical protein
MVALNVTGCILVFIYHTAISHTPDDCNIHILRHIHRPNQFLNQNISTLHSAGFLRKSPLRATPFIDFILNFKPVRQIQTENMLRCIAHESDFIIH